MLYTTAVALHSDQVATVAQREVRNVAPLVLRASHLIPAVVVGELAKDHPDVNHAAIAQAREVAEQAWSPDGKMVHGWPSSRPARSGGPAFITQPPCPLAHQGE